MNSVFYCVLSLTIRLHAKISLQRMQIGENSVQITDTKDFTQKCSGCFDVFLVVSITCATLTATSRVGQVLPENDTKQQEIAVNYI
jgi:hypothetical protein